MRIAIDSLRRGDGEIEVEERFHPLAVIVTQDCDLTWDYEARRIEQQSSHKLLPNILLCELWKADDLRGRQAIVSNIWKRIRQNQDERYHCLQACDASCDLGGAGFPPLAIDFKRVLTVPTEELYYRVSTGQVLRRSVLTGLFLQDLSNRFGYYHLRVALPDPASPAPAAIASAAPGVELPAVGQAPALNPGDD